MTSEVKPLFRKERLRIQSDLNTYNSHANFKTVELNNAESFDRLDQFNKYLMSDNKMIVSKSSSNICRSVKIDNKDNNYLKNTKDLQRKHENQILKQTHFIERLTGNNQSHLAKKLITTPRNVKLLAPLALKRQGKDIDLLADQKQHLQHKFL